MSGVASIVLLGLLSALGAGSSREPVESVERRLGAMGTWLFVRVEAPDRSTALAASERAVAAVEAAEARLSTWRETSELSRLNASPPGVPVRLSNELARDLALALGIARDTRGAFDPTVGALVDCWGLRTGGTRPDDDEVERARAATGHHFLEIDGSFAVRRRADVVVEEGGFGKGIALDDAVAALRASGATRGLVDLGGQLATFGDSEHDVDLADPRDRSRSVLRLRFSGASVATSGNSERAAGRAAEPIGHLLDPATGRPARDFGSVAVVTRSAAVADALSTALFVMGPDAAMRWARDQHDVEVVTLEATPGGLRVVASPGLEGRLTRMTDGIDLTFDRPAPSPRRETVPFDSGPLPDRQRRQQR